MTATSEGPKRITSPTFAEAERLFCAAHPRAVQYLEQAPVLLVSNGVAANGRCLGPMWFQMRLKQSCSDGVKLKDLMRAFCIPYPLRKLCGFSITKSTFDVISELYRVDPRILGQAIPDGRKRQRDWLLLLGEWLVRRQYAYKAGFLRNLGTVPFSWAVLHGAAFLDMDPGLFGGVADHAYRTDDFNPDWGAKRACEQAQLWHDTIAGENIHKKYGVSAEAIIDFSKVPDTLNMKGFDFVCLKRPMDIVDEGRRMRHCVASYVGDVMMGGCHLVSIRDGDRHVATLQLNKTLHSVQLKGRFNSPVSRGCESAAAAYCAAVRKLISAPKGAA